MRFHTDGRAHFLYRAYDAAGALLYVGLTVNPDSRFAYHRTQARYARSASKQHWLHTTARVEWESVGLVRSMAELRELEAIQNEHPRFNRQVNNAAAKGAALVHLVDTFFGAEAS